MDKRKWKIKDKKISKQSQYKFNNQHGITLIALVITIIIMVILAGVSLNATIGENGIISKAQYSIFFSEMTDVEEALKTWQTSKILDDEDYSKRAPTNGLCTPEELQQTKRLMGEVGYYRVWNISASKPTLDLTESSESFDNKYESEFIYYPAGVQDLYYLNNEKLGINKKKKYLIDASTGIIYSVKGANLKGIQCYSLAMAKTVMEGYTDMPSFAELEISTGKNAGNVSNKYKVDENGNYILDGDGNKVENPDYNPYGFEILADYSNDNVYKLYNNGDLYAKGKKGILLNSSVEELNNIDENKWQSTTIPSDIPGASSNEINITIGYGMVFVIDSNRDVWAWGSNSHNKMGLSEEEKIEFSPLVHRKLNINGEKAKKVIDTNWATFIITESNKLYASGSNIYGELGIGRTCTQTEKFELIDFPESVSNIKEIYNQAGDNVSGDGFAIILTTTGNLYFSGRYSRANQVVFKDTTIDLSKLDNGLILSWKELNTNTMFPELDFTKVHGTGSSARWHSSHWLFYADNICYEMLWNGSVKKIENWGDCTKVEVFTGYNSVTPILTKVYKGDTVEWWYYGIDYYAGLFTDDTKDEWNNVTEVMSNVENSTNSKIEDIWFDRYEIAVKLANGDCYGYGRVSALGLGTTGRTYSWSKIEEISNLGDCKFPTPTLPFIVVKDNQLYGVNCVNLIRKESVLQSSWKLIAKDVKYFNPQTNWTTFGVVKNDGALYVRGKDSSYLGLNKVGENISSLTKVTGEGATTEVKNSLATGVKSYNFTETYMYILTNDGNLLVSTYEDNVSSASKGYSGLGAENHPELVSLATNVEQFACRGSYHIYRLTSNDIYWWGNGSGGDNMPVSKIPIKLGDLWKNAGKWYKAVVGSNVWLATENGLITSGIDRNDGYTNGSGKDISGGAFLDTPEKIVNVCSNGAYITLSENGNLYVAGKSNCSGDGQGKYGTVNTILHKVECESKIETIVGGNGFAIGITADGKVYATGNNSLGVLGRWIGVSRGDSNSRYRTAFEWVECPELEI